jgi:hypothetical protein
VILAARLHPSKFQLILCFNIDLKELKDPAIFASCQYKICQYKYYLIDSSTVAINETQIMLEQFNTLTCLYLMIPVSSQCTTRHLDVKSQNWLIQLRLSSES